MSGSTGVISGSTGVLAGSTGPAGFCVFLSGGGPEIRPGNFRATGSSGVRAVVPPFGPVLPALRVLSKCRWWAVLCRAVVPPFGPVLPALRKSEPNGQISRAPI